MNPMVGIGMQPQHRPPPPDYPFPPKAPVMSAPPPALPPPSPHPVAPVPPVPQTPSGSVYYGHDPKENGKYSV